MKKRIRRFDYLKFFFFKKEAFILKCYVNTQEYALYFPQNHIYQKDVCLFTGCPKAKIRKQCFRFANEISKRESVLERNGLLQLFLEEPVQ